jgi:membrane protease subunit HflC
MTRSWLGLAGFLIVVAIIVAYSSLFIVKQTEQALVLQFGEPKRVVREAGLKFKLPFVQNVIFYDRRLLDYAPPAEEIVAADKKRIVVDQYARFRIDDPLKFYQTVGNELGVRNRLSALMSGALRRVVGNVTLASIISPERAQIMQDITKEVAGEAGEFGINVVDVRIRHADLPEENSQAIFDRMKTERQREAKELRAQGAEIAQRIRSRADREKVVILAEAQRQSQITRGEGDSESVRIYAEAFGKDPEFFALYRSLQAYRQALGKTDTTMVLAPDSDFFEFLNSVSGKAGP